MSHFLFLIPTLMVLGSFGINSPENPFLKLSYTSPECPVCLIRIATDSHQNVDWNFLQRTLILLGIG
jgi:hypothetical protein